MNQRGGVGIAVGLWCMQGRRRAVTRTCSTQATAAFNLAKMDMLLSLSRVVVWFCLERFKLSPEMAGFGLQVRIVIPAKKYTQAHPKPTTYHQPTTYQLTTMTKFRPCIDLHAGSVKQIVGGTLTTTDSELKTNFTSKLPSSYYANLYKENALEGAHVIMLGPGNTDACKEACEAWPGHLQVGGGINDGNAKEWIEYGASKVSYNIVVFL